MRSYPLRPLWQQIAYILAFALAMIAAAALCVLALVAMSPAWGVR